MHWRRGGEGEGMAGKGRRGGRGRRGRDGREGKERGQGKKGKGGEEEMGPHFLGQVYTPAQKLIISCRCPMYHSVNKFCNTRTDGWTNRDLH